MLFIGEHNFVNHTIYQTLSAKEEVELYLLGPEDATSQELAYEEPPCEIAIIDLTSSPDGKLTYVKQISRNRFSRKQCILYRGSPEVDPEQLRKVGADRMLSVNTIDGEGLMRSLHDLASS